MSAQGKCPVIHATPSKHVETSTANEHWWPNKLSLKMLSQNGSPLNPMGDSFDYAAEFKTLDINAVKADLEALMTDSQEWWPADYGHYGPFFVRMAWHSAGTYRIHDGRGGGRSGSMRFAPLNSWPDNVNLDKAHMLLMPIKKKYGRKISWADLMILTGTVALESMGLDTVGFAGGREDIWEPEEDIWWGPETEWLDDKRYSGDRELEEPLGAVQMGLIYVNPEGPNGKPDVLAAAVDIRETFRRMAMDDEETVALIAGGHTFGKTHGASEAENGPEPEAAPLEQMGTGWSGGVGADAVGSGLEGAWTDNPIQWDNNFFDNLFGYEWELKKGPGGGWQWYPEGGAAADAFPDAHDPKKRHAPMMFTTDLALRMDPEYGKISKRFHENPDQFAKAFADAWFKLTHRDMGPVSRYIGKGFPNNELWQDIIPAPTGAVVNAADIKALKSQILATGLSVSQLVSTAWASASTFRSTDLRGGANGARVSLAPQKDWPVNNPKQLSTVLSALEGIQDAFNSAENSASVSLADLIVLGGAAAIEHAAKATGQSIVVPFTPGRTDASQAQTDSVSFEALEPKADGFRNYYGKGAKRQPAELLVDKAHFLSLSPPQMTALIGGMRVLGTNADGSDNGVLTKNPGTLSNDFFVNLLDMNTVWAPDGDNQFKGTDRKTGKGKWSATSVDLVFGSNSVLRAIAEVYASDDSNFVQDFVAAWAQVMELDRFDI